MTYFTTTGEDKLPEMGAAGLLAMALFIAGAAAFGAVSAWLIV